MSGESGEMGQRLRALRQLHDLTQQEFADLAGVSKSLVSKVETGNKPGTWDLAIAAAKALRVDAGALMGDAPSDVLEPSGRIAGKAAVIRPDGSSASDGESPIRAPASTRNAFATAIAKSQVPGLMPVSTFDTSDFETAARSASCC